MNSVSYTHLDVYKRQDFTTLFTEFNPHLYFGGDNVAFWGPLSWTMIFGLAFATFLTLILVPCMYLLGDINSKKIKGLLKKKPATAEQLSEAQTKE